MPPATSASARTRMPFGALLVLSMIGFTAITTELLPSGLLPQISAGLNVSEPVAGYLTAGYAAVIVATVIPAAMLLSRVPRHTLLVALVLTFAISNALVGLVSDFGAALAARLVGGIAHGLLWTTMAPFVARIVPAHKVGKAMAIVFSGNSLGLAIGAPLGTALGGLIGWRASFLLLAGTGVVLAALAMWLLPAVRRIPDAPRPSLRKAAAQPGVMSVAIAWPLMLMAHFALFTFIAPFLREAGLPDYSITLSLTVLGISGLVGIWIAGITVDMRPRRSLLITTAVVAVVFLLPAAGRGHRPRRPGADGGLGSGLRRDRHLQPVRHPPRRQGVPRGRQRPHRPDHPAGDHHRRALRRGRPHYGRPAAGAGRRCGACRRRPRDCGDRAQARLSARAERAGLCGSGTGCSSEHTPDACSGRGRAAELRRTCPPAPRA